MNQNNAQRECGTKSRQDLKAEDRFSHSLALLSRRLITSQVGNPAEYHSEFVDPQPGGESA